MRQYIYYKCKKCGEDYRILSQWGDLKPQVCVGKKGKCRARFDKQPSMLEIKFPKKAKPATKEVAPSKQKKSNKNKESHTEK